MFPRNSYPFEEHLSGFPCFPLVYASTLYAAFMISATIGAIDGLCVTFSLYFAAMFKTLQYEIQELFAGLKDTNGKFMRISYYSNIHFICLSDYRFGA